jgi:hypothetical protein
MNRPAYYFRTHAGNCSAQEQEDDKFQTIIIRRNHDPGRRVVAGLGLGTNSIGG